MRAPRGFKFDEFDVTCGELDGEQLQLKWQHYTRALSAASTSTAVATLAAAPTGGVSMIGAMIAGPLMHNARKKRQIIEHHMSVRGLKPETRNKDIYGPMAFSAVLGGATMGVGSAGAELLAVDTMTKIVSHAAVDAGVTAVEDKHSQREHEKEMEKHGQLVRANTAPTSLGVPVNPNAGQVLIKHAKSMPTSLGSTTNGFIASAARLKAEKYPLLKEYLTSVAAQSRGYMSKSTSKEGAPRAPFPDDTMGNNESYPSSSTSLTQVQGTVFMAELEDTSPSSATFKRDPVELDSTPLTAPSELDTCSSAVISPLSPPSTVTNWPSPHPSLVSEMEDTSSPGSSTAPSSAWPSELPADTETIMSSLLDTIDETTLTELEADLECAIVEMDNPDTWVEQLPPAEGGEAGPATVAALALAPTPTPPATNNNNRMSRTFEQASDLDTLVRRHSTRFNRRRASQRLSYASYSSSVYSQSSSATLRKPTPQEAHQKQRATIQSYDGGLMVMSIEEEERDHKHNPFYDPPASETAFSPLPAYSAMDMAAVASSSSAPVYGGAGGGGGGGNPNHGIGSPSASVRGRQAEAWVDEKRRSVDPVLHSRHPSLRPGQAPQPPRSQQARSMPFSPDDMYSSPTGTWRADETEGEEMAARQQQLQKQLQQGLLVPHRSATQPVSSGGGSSSLLVPSPSPSPSSAKSRAGSLALSAHEGMKKVGYLGLEPATKIAIGASLLMVGVRPSVQRKYLDKAKGKMGLMPEDKGDQDLVANGKWY
ncbi:hypothetical protein Daus18300_008405 [Diaporthe australafricana]|uniref:Uncharacterized protein n=1 Tax=Diaporthe australafricana TaxID=127596 RepID=A0ABR3WIQ0_9PEZI